MGYEVTRIEGRPVVVVEYTEPYDPGVDVKESHDAIYTAINQALADQPAYVYLIFDLSQVDMVYSGSVQAVGELFTTEEDLTELEGIQVDVFFVGPEEYVEFSTWAAQDAVDAPEVFPTLEQVLAHIEAA